MFRRKLLALDYHAAEKFNPYGDYINLHIYNFD